MMRSRFMLAVLASLMLVGLPGRAAEPTDREPLPFAPKATAPIGIVYKLKDEPRVGVSLDVALTVSAGAALADAELTLGADDPLALIDPLAPVDLGTFEQGEKRELVVTVLPLLAQTHYLRVAVAADIDGVRQTRSVVVPIRIPDAAPRKSTSQTAGKSDDSVRSFEAIETDR